MYVSRHRHSCIPASSERISTRKRILSQANIIPQRKLQSISVQTLLPICLPNASVNSWITDSAAAMAALQENIPLIHREQAAKTNLTRKYTSKDILRTTDICTTNGTVSVSCTAPFYFYGYCLASFFSILLRKSVFIFSRI